MNKQAKTIKRFAGRAALTLLLAVLATATAWADNNDPIISGYTATAGAAGANSSEGYACLVDDDPRTKWCVTSLNNCYIEFHTASAFVPTGYVMTTASDNASYKDRRPKRWTIQAKANSGDSWTTIATVTNNSDVDSRNCRDTEFTLSNTSTAYRYFRLEISAVQSGSKFQLAEFRFKGHNATVANKQYIKDVMLIGGDQSTVNSLKTTYQNQGWTFIDNNLNQGKIDADFVYLLCKYDNSKAANLSYISDLYISTTSVTAPDELTVDDGRTFYLVPYDGSGRFKGNKGNLNSNAGGADIHLYYTKTTYNSTFLSGISFTIGAYSSSGALGSNNDGWGTGYDLNSGADGEYIFLHATTATANTYTVNLDPGFSGEATSRVDSDRPEYIAASKAEAQNLQFYNDNGSIGLKLEPTFDNGLTNGDNIFVGWGRGNVTYHTLTSTRTSFTGQWAVPDYIVRLVNEFDGTQFVYKTLAQQVTTTKAAAQNLQFYNDNGSIGFKLEPTNPVFSLSDNYGFLGWNFGKETYHSLQNQQTTFTSYWLEWQHDYNTITGYSCSEAAKASATVITIPNRIGGNWIYYLSCSFSGFTNLETIKFYYDTRIGSLPDDFANGCSKLKSVLTIDSSGLSSEELPNGITMVGERAFKQTGITLLDMHKVYHVGTEAFYGCPNLRSVSLTSTIYPISFGSRVFAHVTSANCTVVLWTSLTNYSSHFDYEEICKCSPNLTIQFYGDSSCLGWCGDSEGLHNIFWVYRNKVLTINGRYNYSTSSYPQIQTHSWKGTLDQLIRTVKINHVSGICNEAFKECKNLTDLYYEGTKAEWDAVTKGTNWKSGVASNFKEHWHCTVSFDANGRGTNPNAQAKIWSNEVTERPITPAVTGYEVAGWYTEAACTTRWNFGTNLVPGDMTLYALWTESIHDASDNNLTAWDGKLRDATLDGRTIFLDDAWNTLCLPFSLSSFAGTPLAGLTVMELDTDAGTYEHKTGFDDGTLYLNFKKATSIEAGKPYIVKGKAATNISYNVISASEGRLGADCLFDGNEDTKWNCSGHSSKPWSIVFNSSSPVWVTGYELLYSNSYIWTLQAKLNDDDTWVTIDSQDRKLYDKYTRIVVSIAPNKQGLYKYFRLEVLETKDSYDYDCHSESNDYGVEISELSIQFTDRITSPLFTEVIVSSTEPTAVTSDDGKVSFVGSYSPVPLTANDKSVLYLGAGNTLYWPSATKTVGSCRAYFQLNGLSASTPTAAVRDFVLNFDEDDATGISSIENGKLKIENAAGAGWYDLSGRKLSGKPTKKGLYINNGRKVVIK